MQLSRLKCVSSLCSGHATVFLPWSAGGFKSPKLLLQFSHRAVAAALCVAGVALGDICLHFAWQAWHLATLTSTLAGVALGDICLHFAWHLATSTSTLRGRCDNYGIWWHAWFPVEVVVATAVSVAGVALGDIDVHSAWQACLYVTGLALVAFVSHANTPLCHTKLFHTTLSQIPFTHNFVTQAFHTQLCHTQLSHTQLCHTQLFHTTLLHAQLCHIHLFHTQSFTHNFVTYNSFTHNTFTSQTYTLDKNGSLYDPAGTES